MGSERRAVIGEAHAALGAVDVTDRGSLAAGPWCNERLHLRQAEGLADLIDVETWPAGAATAFGWGIWSWPARLIPTSPLLAAHTGTPMLLSSPLGQGAGYLSWREWGRRSMRG
jgi:hypothetical protein